MKCKAHPYEPGPGVCAACLRDRLLALLAEGDTCPSPLRSSAAQPDPASPHVAYRYSFDDCGRSPAHRRERLFFSTPQIGPSKAAPAPGARRKLFPSFSALFRSSPGTFRSGDVSGDLPELGFEKKSGSRSDPPRASTSEHGSWFSGMIKWRRRSKDGSDGGRDRKGVEKWRACQRDRCRGLSPDLEMTEDEAGEEYQWESSPYRSEFTTESFSSPAWRIPAPTPLRQRADRGPAALSGFAFCLSPLVRPGHQRRSQVVAGDVVPYSGDLRASPASKHSRWGYATGSGGGGGAAGSALRQNRSRKLADAGRFR